MTQTPTFSHFIARLHRIHCPFTLDLTELDLCTASSDVRLHLLHFLLASIAPTLAPPSAPSEPSSSIDALIASCVSVGACDSSEAAMAVCGVSGGAWTVNGRVLAGLLELVEARQSVLQPFQSAFDGQLSLLAAGCTSASALLSTDLHLFPADILLTNKQLSQQQTGRALVALLAQQTESMQSQLDALPASATPSSTSSSALPPLLSSIALLSAALPAFHSFHSQHIAPHQSALTASATVSAISAAAVASSLSDLSSARSPVVSQLRLAQSLSESMAV